MNFLLMVNCYLFIVRDNTKLVGAKHNGANNFLSLNITG